MFSWGWNKYGQVRMENGNFWASKMTVGNMQVEFLSELLREPF
jgi:hypothetical protein